MGTAMEMDTLSMELQLAACRQVASPALETFSHSRMILGDRNEFSETYFNVWLYAIQQNKKIIKNKKHLPRHLIKK